MERWCRVVVLVLCLSAVTWSGANADYQMFLDHFCTYFSRLDFDGDLRLTIDDFVDMFVETLVTDKTLTFNGVVLGVIQLEALGQQAAKFFPLGDETLLQAVLTDGVSLKDYLASMSARRFSPELESSIVDAATFFIKTFNSEGADMNVTIHEFSTAYRVFRVDPSAVPAGFARMDKNKDGVIELSECIQDGSEYFNQADDPGNTWAGPLVTCDTVSKNNPSVLPIVSPVGTS